MTRYTVERLSGATMEEDGANLGSETESTALPDHLMTTMTGAVSNGLLATADMVAPGGLEGSAAISSLEGAVSSPEHVSADATNTWDLDSAEPYAYSRYDDETAGYADSALVTTMAPQYTQLYDETSGTTSKL